MLSVSLVGLGRIGAGFDEPNDPAIKTHLKAILREPRFTIAALSDIDYDRAERERIRFSVDAPVVAPEAALAAPVDVVCIATPDGTHRDFMERALQARARVIVCEKPIEGSEAARMALLQQARAGGRDIVVNHSRRWIPPLAGWAAEARSGGFGLPRSAVVHYNRGFRHNGTHALDLIADCLAPDVAAARHISPPLHDFSEADPTLSLLVNLRSLGAEFPLVLLPVDGRIQSAFSVDIRFDRARIVVEDRFGIRAELHRPSSTGYSGYASELIISETYFDDPPRLMSEMWTNVADHLEKAVPLRCSGEDAVAAYRLADAIEARLGG